VPEDNSASLLLLMGQLWGIVFTFALPPLIDMSPSVDCSSVLSPLALLLTIFMVIAAAVLLMYRKDYRRQKAEKEGTAAEAVADSEDAADASPVAAAAVQPV